MSSQQGEGFAFDPYFSTSLLPYFLLPPHKIRSHLAHFPNRSQPRQPGPTPSILRAAEKLLDAAGHPRAADGIGFHLTLKTCTQEQARLIGAALQEQWRKAGIDPELRLLEFATLISNSIR